MTPYVSISHVASSPAGISPSGPVKLWSLPTPPPSLSELSALAAFDPSSSEAKHDPGTNASTESDLFLRESTSVFAGSRPPNCISPVWTTPGLTEIGSRATAAARLLATGVGAWLALYLVCNLALTLHNKHLLNHFPFPWTLTALHAFSAALGSWICAWRGVFKPAPLSHPTTPLLALFSVLYSANIAASNASLHLVSIATHQVVRAATPLFVVLFAWAKLGRVDTSSARLKSLTPVVLGVVFATYGDYTYTRTGLALTLLGTALAALKTMLASRVVRPPKIPSLLATDSLPTHSAPDHAKGYPRAHIRRSSLKRLEDEGYLSEGERLREPPKTLHRPPNARALHPLDVLFRLSPLACVQCLIVAWASGETAKWGDLHPGAGLNLGAIGWRELGPKLAFNGALAFVLNYVSFVASRRAGALSMTVVANVKQVLTILIALLVFDPHTPSTAHVLGVVLTLAGGVWYGFIEAGERREREDKVDM